MKSAQNSFDRLKNIISKIKDDKKNNGKYLEEFENNINDDLNIPQALATLWNLVRDEKAVGKYRTIKKMDQVLSLNLLEKEKILIPQEIKGLVEKREKVRKDGNFEESDKIRKEIEEQGWKIKDTSDGPELSPR